MNLQPLDSLCSKNAELEFLDKVTKLAGNESYIGSLFGNSCFRQWVKNAMDQDTSCDLIDTYLHEQREHNKTRDALSKLQLKLANTERQIEIQAQIHASALEKASEELKEETRKLEEYRVWSNDLQQLINQLVDELKNLRPLVAALKGIKLRLKSIVYDAERGNSVIEPIEEILKSF